MRALSIERTPLPLKLPNELKDAVRDASRCVLDPALPPLHLLEFDPARFEPRAFAAAAMPCPERVERSVHKRQAEFFFGRLAARSALNDLGASSAVEIGIGPSREPVWPDGIVGSITHSGRYAAALAMPTHPFRGVGIDIETVIGPRTRNALLACVVNGDEATLLQKQARTDWPADALLTAVFSAKESLFKAAFGVVGRYFDFSAARCDGWDESSGRLRLVIAEDLCPQFPIGRVCELGVRRIDHDSVLTFFAW